MNFAYKTSFRFGLVLTFALASVNCEPNSLTARKESLDFESEILDVSFAESTRRIFWHVQEEANKLIEKGNEDGYVIKKISSLFTNILATSYASSKRTFEVSQIILEKQFGYDDAQVLEMEVSRRGWADVLYYNTLKWKELHKLLKHYVKANSIPLMRELADIVYLEQEDLSTTADELDEPFDILASRRGLSKKEKEEFMNELDKRIDSTLGISGSKVEHIQLEDSFFRSRLLFQSSKELEEYTKKKVDLRLQEALKESDEATREHVIEFSPEEIEAVSMEDIVKARTEFLLSGFAERVVLK